MQIIISGMVGVGKSTISEKLYDYFTKNFENRDIVFFNELQVDNPYLDFFYKERTEWSFLIQVDFLLERFKNLIKEQKHKNAITIFDRHFIDDFVFLHLESIKNDINSFNLNICFSLNKYLSEKMFSERKPDYFFLLKADYKIILSRIKKRGRSFEKGKDLEVYWKDMYHAYYENDVVLQYLKSNVKKFFIIDANKSTNVILNQILSTISSIERDENKLQISLLDNF